MIEKTLSKAQADELFEQEAVLFGTTDGIPEYRVAEIFGEKVSAWAESCMDFGGYLKCGEDWSIWNGGCHYFRRYGFYQIVSQHNYFITMERHKASDGGKIVDALWQARSERIAAQDAEDERRREERRQKRPPLEKQRRAVHD